jgi:hypothetical protein
MEFDELSRNVIGCAIRSSSKSRGGAVGINISSVLGLRTVSCGHCISDGGAAASSLQGSPARLRLSDRFAGTSRSNRRNQECRNTSSNSPSANSYLHATRQRVAWLANQFQRHKAPKRHQTFRSVVLRDLRGEGFTGLVLHRAERKNGPAVQFIENLREAGVDRGETAEDSFVASCVCKALTRTGKIADGEHKEQNR